MKFSLNFILFAVIPFILMLASSIWMPFWKVRVLKQAGEKILPLVKKKSWLNLLEVPLAIIILILSILFDFGKMNFVVPYCAVLGLFISEKESTFIPINGVYEKLVIAGSEIIFFKDIIKIFDSDASMPDYVIKVQTKRGTRQISLSNSNEAEEVKKVLKAICKDIQ